MEYSVKLVLTMVALVSVFITSQGQNTASSTTTPAPGCCTEGPPEKWDPVCSAPGVYKSVSKCYTQDGQTVSRYDYYQCVAYDGGYLMYRKNCSTSTECKNAYDDATKSCLSAPPPSS